MKRLLLTMLALVFALALVACGGGGDEPDAGSGGTTETVRVEMHDIYYGASNDNQASPPVWNATSGATVTVNADNQGTLEHNWAIIEADATLPDVIADRAEIEDQILFDIGNVAGGSTDTARFTAPEPGTYTILCTVAGHYPSMQGRLEVGG